MIVLALGKKGSGKTTLLRKLAYRRLCLPARPLVLWHDPGAQLADTVGRHFAAVRTARDWLKLHGSLPQLSVFRGADVEELAKLAIDLGDVTLVMDELDRACRDKRWLSESVRRIVHEGRHLRVDLFGSFRSTRNVSEDLLGQADHVFLMRHTAAGEYDLGTIARRFGDRYASAVQALEPMQFLAWSDD